jgi:hypothetical protein
MYDTLNLWHRGACFEIAPLLTNVSEHKRDESYYITGMLGNLNLLLSENGVSIKGSLAKWYLNDNMQTLTRQDTQRGIENLSDVLNIDINKTKVKRLDLGMAFITKYPTSVYFPYLGGSQYYTRNEKNTSLYYENGNKTKLFYDKIAEVKFRGLTVPKILEHQDFLRYEVRFMRRLDKQFNMAEVKALNLYNEDFYINVVDMWVKEFKSINKLKVIAMKQDRQYLPKDILDQLILIGISHIGGQSQAMEMIDEMRKKGQLKRVEYSSRTKAMIKELCQLDSLTEDSELTLELESKITSVQKYYR